MRIEALRRAFGDASFSAGDAALVLGIRSPYSSLNRLRTAGVLDRVGYGVYRFSPLDQPLLTPYLERESIRATRADREATFASLARKRWASWIQQGFIEPLGERRFRVTLRQETEGGVRVRRKSSS